MTFRPDGLRPRPAPDHRLGRPGGVLPHLRQCGVFVMLVTKSPWVTVSGLVVSSLFAAPFAAMLTRRLSTKALPAMVGTVIVLISVFDLAQALA